ncbi:peptidase inhibitor family I36 protein [Streptomyces sp. NPDC001544]|uniref:peptidase inhibitor family I36 protein n=1 Tax=Streptomyces sp. NPDC001544 TaxID=3364584 RepID=UPI0036CFC495
MSSYEQEHDRKSSRTPRRGRRALAAAAITFATGALGLIAPNTASASTQAAWDCPSGDLCVWTGSNGTGSRCTWSNADPDWWSGSIQCSWSDTQNVGSAKNSGTSSSYGYVVLYTGANYTGDGYCIAQHGDTWPGLNVRFRSHRWEASC